MAFVKETMHSALEWDGWSAKTISGRFLILDKAEEFPRGKLEADITEFLSRSLLRFLVDLIEIS